MRLSFKINGKEEKNDANKDDYMKQTANDTRIRIIALETKWKCLEKRRIYGANERKKDRGGRRRRRQNDANA